MQANNAIKAALTERLGVRAKAFASDDELVTDSVLTLAVSEALDLAGENTALPVLVDIAFHRFLLQIRGNNIDETAQRAYHKALSQITDPQAPAISHALSQSKQRVNSYQ